MQSYFLDDEVKKNKGRTWSRSSWAAECSQADARDLRKNYSSAKLICVSEEQETDDDWMRVLKHCWARERKEKD